MYLEVFINENYLTFLLLGGLLIVMYAYRDVHLPASRNFMLIMLVLLFMCISNGAERWAVLSQSRLNIRIAASVVHYLLQPLVIYLELLIILPRDDSLGRNRSFIVNIPIILNTLIYLAAPFTGELVFWYGNDYAFHRGPLGLSIYIVTFWYLTLLLYWSFRFLKGNERRKGIILFFMVGTGVLTGLLEFLNIVTGYIDETFALGIFLYYMYLITLHESEMQAQLASQELELSKSKVKLLRQQIRPHFIFNSLHIVKSLIRSDQDKAVESLEDFSDYLRANIDAITSDNLIAFEEELSHIKAYLALALADESKGISVEYDIKESDFRLPPLTIEPLVENAVRHGVKKGGNIRLSTYDDEGTSVIKVADNGGGFDSSAAVRSQRAGTGINNARSRLATMCGGTLDIQSDENGTEATVRIPGSRSSK